MKVGAYNGNRIELHPLSLQRRRGHFKWCFLFLLDYVGKKRQPKTKKSAIQGQTNPIA